MVLLQEGIGPLRGGRAWSTTPTGHERTIDALLGSGGVLALDLN
jgi:hypothetical protein